MELRNDHQADGYFSVFLKPSLLHRKERPQEQPGGRKLYSVLVTVRGVSQFTVNEVGERAMVHAEL